MTTHIDSDVADHKHTILQSTEMSKGESLDSVGPLFKDLYAGIVDIDDRKVVHELLSSQTRAFMDQTTDIQNYAQFQSLHRLPEKWGTVFHHRTYVATVDLLQK